MLQESKVAIGAFIASRVALLVVGLMAKIFLQPLMSRANPVAPTHNPALNVWGAWDTGWLLSLARDGYAAHPEPNGQANWAFFPAYPMLSAGLAATIHLPVFVTMLLVSNLAFFSALLLVHRYARAEFDQRTADIAVVLICAVPGSYIYSSAYTESLFLLAVVSALWFVRRKQWIAAGLCGGGATLTRNLGVGLELPILVAAAPPLIAMARELQRGALARRTLLATAARVAAGLAMPVLALAAFCAFLYVRTGDPVAFVSAQKAWGRSIGYPILTVVDGLVHFEHVPDANLINFIFAWVSLALLGVLAAMRKWELFALGCFMALVPLSTGVASYARYCLVALPLFLAAARLLASRPAALAAAVLAMATINGFMMVAWSFCLMVVA